MRRAWFGWFFPALVLNYFGQGALLLGDPAAIENPFYLLAPEWALYPLVGLASMRDDHRLAGGDLRRFLVSPARRSSSAICPGSKSATPRRREIGQVYVPRINYIAADRRSSSSCSVFRSSDNLGAAYGIAVSGDDGDHDDAGLSLHAQPGLEPRRRGAAFRRFFARST